MQQPRREGRVWTPMVAGEREKGWDLGSVLADRLDVGREENREEARMFSRLLDGADDDGEGGGGTGWRQEA